MKIIYLASRLKNNYKWSEEVGDALGFSLKALAANVAKKAGGDFSFFMGRWIVTKKVENINDVKLIKKLVIMTNYSVKDNNDFEIGTVELPEEIGHEDMPECITINGVDYLKETI